MAGNSGIEEADVKGVQVVELNTLDVLKEIGNPWWLTYLNRKMYVWPEER